MSVIQGKIQDGVFAGMIVNIDVPTARVPELPVAILPQPTDVVVLYQEDGNKTTQLALDAIRQLIIAGAGATALTPIVAGADVSIYITAAMAGVSRVNVPQLANEMFSLEKRGVGGLLTTEYNILSSGGFELNPKDANGNVVEPDDPNAIPQLVAEGDIFIAHVYKYMPNVTSTNTIGSLLTGFALINTNTQLGALHRNKLLHASFGDAAGVITLEDINDAPENTLVIVETLLNNNKQTKIIAKAGQKIYYNSTSYDYLYLGISETLWLYRNTDGWYVLNNLPGYDFLGDEIFGRVVKPNMLIAMGQLINRADYPRLWEWVQSLGIALVDDATWNSIVQIPGALAGGRLAYRPYEGCYSTGNGTTTFRLPNLQEKFMRGLNNIFIGDTQRTFNQPGGVQYDTVGKHTHDAKYEKNGTDGTANGEMFYNGDGEGNGNGLNSQTIQPGGAFESRGINVGYLPLIRA